MNEDENVDELSAEEQKAEKLCRAVGLFGHNEPYQLKQKHHATVKAVCKTMEPFGIKNLIIYHTEDSHEDKKELYTKEAKEYFSGNVIVPNDLDVIEL